jgi:hypothetical protein
MTLVKANMRCSLRESVLGAYNPFDQRIALPYATPRADVDSDAVIYHEMTHRDLSEKTIGGLFDLLLAKAENDTAIGGNTRNEISATFEQFFFGSFVVQEGTATYVSAVMAGSAARSWEALSSSYRKALDVVLTLLPSLNDHPRPSSYLHVRIAVAAARSALNWLRFEDIKHANPNSWGELHTLLLAETADDRFRKVIANLKRKPGLRGLEAKALGIVGASNIDELEQRLVSVDIPECMRLLEEIERHVYSCSGVPGPYRTGEEHNEFFRRLFAFCKERILDEHGRPVFESFDVGSIEEHAAVRIRHVIAKEQQIWRGPSYTSVVKIEHALDWLSKFKSLTSIERDAGREAVLQCRLSARVNYSEVLQDGISTGDLYECASLVLDPYVIPYDFETDSNIATLVHHLRSELGGVTVTAGFDNIRACHNFIVSTNISAIWHADVAWALAVARGETFPFSTKSRVIFYLIPLDTAELETVLDLLTKGAVIKGWFLKSPIMSLGFAMFGRADQENTRWAYPMDILFGPSFFYRLKLRFRDRFEFEPNYSPPQGEDPYLLFGAEYFFRLLIEDGSVPLFLRGDGSTPTV